MARRMHKWELDWRSNSLLTKSWIDEKIVC